MFAVRHDSPPMATAADETNPAICEENTPRSPFIFTKHAMLRQAQRNLSGEQLDYVLHNADCVVERAGATFLILLDKHIPLTDRRDDDYSRLSGTVMVLAPDGAVLTVYKHLRALSRIRRKVKYDRRSRSEWGQRTNHPRSEVAEEQNRLIPNRDGTRIIEGKEGLIVQIES